MGELITDEMLHTFSVVGTPAEAGKALRERYDDLIDRLSFYMPYDGARGVLPEVLSALKA